MALGVGVKHIYIFLLDSKVVPHMAAASISVSVGKHQANVPLKWKNAI